jgi:hypothetical protein
MIIFICIVAVLLSFGIGFLTGFTIFDTKQLNKENEEFKITHTTVDGITLLEASTNKEIAQLNIDESERSYVLRELYRGINNSALKGNTRFHPNSSLNNYIQKQFEVKELIRIFNAFGYEIKFKCPTASSAISYISWED